MGVLCIESIVIIVYYKFVRLFLIIMKFIIGLNYVIRNCMGLMFMWIIINVLWYIILIDIYIFVFFY